MTPNIVKDSRRILHNKVGQHLPKSVHQWHYPSMSETHSLWSSPPDSFGQTIYDTIDGQLLQDQFVDGFFASTEPLLDVIPSSPPVSPPISLSPLSRPSFGSNGSVDTIDISDGTNCSSDSSGSSGSTNVRPLYPSPPRPPMVWPISAFQPNNRNGLPMAYKMKAKQNDKYCEVVPVPSTNHVAQIVGKQGARIKLMRTKFGVHIQTPVAGQEPVFIITGVREKVLEAKREILNTSHRFTEIGEDRKQRYRHNSQKPGSIGVNLVVPPYYVGLIVGRIGNKIRKIQEDSGTYIESPKPDDNNGSTFRITGPESCVQMAQQMFIYYAREKLNKNFWIDMQPSGDYRLCHD